MKVATFLLVISLTLFAQKGGGIYGGVNFEITTFTPIQDTLAHLEEAGNGFSFYLGYEYDFSRLFTLALGIAYARPSASFQRSQGNDHTWIYDYPLLSLPLRSKFYAPTKLGKLFLVFEQDFGFDRYYKRVGDDYYEEKIHLDYSLGLFIGGEIHINRYSILLESGYSYGVNGHNVTDSFYSLNPENKIHLHTITILSVGVRFKLKDNA